MTESLFWNQSLFSFHDISLPLPCGQEEQNRNEQNPCSLDISRLNQVMLPATSWVRLSPAILLVRWEAAAQLKWLSPPPAPVPLGLCPSEISLRKGMLVLPSRVQPVGLPTPPLPYLSSLSPPRQRTDLPLVIKHSPVTPQQENTWASLGLQDPFLFLSNSPLIYRAKHQPPTSPPCPTQHTTCRSSAN